MTTTKIYAFDSSLVIRFLRGKLPLTLLLPELTYVIPAVVLGELLLGVLKSANSAVKLTELNGLIAPFPIAHVDSSVAAEYAKIKFELEAAGGRIPENDMWIAATAGANQFTLLTCDQHFDRVTALDVVKYE